jgi:predicted Zn finger-like uncharacterized protein
MELICPSCEARYRVPQGALGSNGRQVSCSNCGHGWHASPPLALGSAGGTIAGAGSYADEEQGGLATAEVHRLRPVESARAAQLAGIREQIDDVQSHEAVSRGDDERTRLAGVADPTQETGYRSGGSPALAAAAASTDGAARARGDLRRADEAGQTHQDPLRRRMAEHDARAAREREEREHLRLSMSQGDRSTGSGAFLTGFVLVVIVAAVLLATYMLRDEIVARVPESGPMIDEYVAWVNELRLAVGEAWQAFRAWVLDLARR